MKSVCLSCAAMVADSCASDRCEPQSSALLVNDTILAFVK